MTIAEVLLPEFDHELRSTRAVLEARAALRSFIVSHMVHHRGQFTVSLRLRDALLPSVYGPTADV
ncbi:MAG TPA: DinB family protein [Gemmatimonadales bacterium]|nr:DinB family protein [Gemmatimonadales bacterium]